MRFKKLGESKVQLRLSKNELKKYPSFKELNEINDDGMKRSIEDGEYKVKLNDVPLSVKVNLRNLDFGYTAEGVVNNSSYLIFKDRPIRKFDIFRYIVEHYLEIVK